MHASFTSQANTAHTDGPIVTLQFSLCLSVCLSVQPTVHAQLRHYHGHCNVDGVDGN